MSNADNVYILVKIVERLGEAAEQDVRIELEGMTNADFIAKGRKIGTSRMCKELARNYGRFAEWLSGATEAQCDALDHIDMDWLRVAAWTARQAEISYEAMKAGKSAGTGEKTLREAKAAETLARARLKRDWGYGALKRLSGRIPDWMAKLEVAYATSSSKVPVADALVALAGVADAMLADTSKGMKARRKKSRVNASAVEAWRTLAAEARETAEVADVSAPAPPVTQNQVDLWDGMAITLFEDFVATVEQAREADPAIPAPSIISLQHWFRRSSTKPTATVEEDTDEPKADEPKADG